MSQLPLGTPPAIKDASSCEARHLSGGDPAGRPGAAGRVGGICPHRITGPGRAGTSCNYSSRGPLSGPKYEEEWVWACGGAAEDHG